MPSFSNGYLVWVDLGHSYGRWPAEIVEPNDMRKEASKSQDESKSFVPKRDPESSLKNNSSDDATSISSSRKTPLKDISSRSNDKKDNRHTVQSGLWITW